MYKLFEHRLVVILGKYLGVDFLVILCLTGGGTAELFHSGHTILQFHHPCTRVLISPPLPTLTLLLIISTRGLCTNFHPGGAVSPREEGAFHREDSEVRDAGECSSLD